MMICSMPGCQTTAGCVCDRATKPFFRAGTPGPQVVYAYADDIARKDAEIGRLLAALKPFCEADWYADGHGRFDGKIAGADLDRAKRAYQQQLSAERK